MTKPLPDFPKISIDAIKPASCLLFYGGNKLTEFFGNTIYRHPYKPPAFHAAVYVGKVEYLGTNLLLNVGAHRLLEELRPMLQTTRRVDVLEYDMPDSTREKIKTRACHDTSKLNKLVDLPDYGWSDYLRFGFRFLKPSSKDFCSENVVELLENYGGVKASEKKAVDTAPWHLLEFALKSPSTVHPFTLYTGKDFKG